MSVSVMELTLGRGTEFSLAWTWNWTCNCSRACVLCQLATAVVWLPSQKVYLIKCRCNIRANRWVWVQACFGASRTANKKLGYSKQSSTGSVLQRCNLLYCARITLPSTVPALFSFGLT